KAYLHRSGRTARAGAAGTVVTVVLPEQRRDVKDLLRKAQITAELEAVNSTIADELIGERAAHVRPAPVQPQQKQQPRKPRPGSQSRADSGSANTPPARRR